MRKILSEKEAAHLSKSLKQENKKIILVGGCFDVLHLGHIHFLNSAKKNADALILLLESDENIKRFKGEHRPINSQKNRSIVLKTLSSVDFIIPLKGVTKNEDYDKLIVQIEPDFIALTKGDKNLTQRQKQSDMIGAKLVQIERAEGLSSSIYIENIK